MILGSGLGFLGDVVEDPRLRVYRDIPHLKASTAPSTRAGWCSAPWRAGRWP
jgi:hypothetical protein